MMLAALGLRGPIWGGCTVGQQKRGRNAQDGVGMEGQGGRMPSRSTCPFQNLAQLWGGFYSVHVIPLTGACKPQQKPEQTVLAQSAMTSDAHGEGAPAPPSIARGLPFGLGRWLR